MVYQAGLDLQLLAVRFVDNGHPSQELGPRYRVWFRNNGPDTVNTPFNILLIASNDSSPGNQLPQSGVVFDRLEPNVIKSVDIRLPFAANQMFTSPDGYQLPFNFLHVLVDSHRQVQETDLTNNGSVIARTEVLPADPAAFSSNLTAVGPGVAFDVACEAIGPEPGQVVLIVNGTQIQAEVEGWYDLGVHVTVPPLELEGAMDAELIVVRGDSAATNPIALQVAPVAMLEENGLPLAAP